ncbi:ABC transporter [Clostridium carboxidivorans P7]|uniref:ABC transporter ATP-binding protein n=1 Tax=Clostridium carboxidivorans TaxID=217159 RepID=UPI0001D39559|nr:ABC transporter ATP-binding protein [Clostridium carboxidivorans]AKN30545.1 ABC transporter [Clostridium carboxidivorans P7]EFG86291.1 ABC transporter, ATP-binding protein [Clostridium carboxidivorans P7]
MLFKMENVNLIYDIDKEVPTYALKNINLSLDGRNFIGIMGPSGSGKSSLLYALAGFKIPTSGKVYYNDLDYSKVSPSENENIRRREFGFIFQRHFLIDYMTVMQNVLTPINDDSKTSKAKAFSILNSFGIAHLADKKPHQLSVGQRQLTAIARALINDPKVIFADEPTAALDHTSAKKVINFLENYKKDTMIIIVTHDHSILKNADHVINMLDGTIESIDKERE